MPNARRMEKEWECYRAVVVPSDAGETQITETRLAFMAGAQTLLAIIMRDLTPGLEPTAQDINMIDEIAVELRSVPHEHFRRPRRS